MKQLTIEEEKDILQDLLDSNSEPIGVGSSRATYQYQPGKVVKIAISQHGILQNETEVSRFSEFGDKNILSKIYSYGQLIIIAEEVRLLENYEYESEDERNEIHGYVESLCRDYLELIDESIDGQQVGFNTSGLIVFYDYGYEYQRSGQVGDMDSWNDNYNIVGYAKSILEGSESLMTSYEDDDEEYESTDNPYNHFSHCKCYACEDEGINGHQEEEVLKNIDLENLASNYACCHPKYREAVNAEQKVLSQYLKDTIGYEGNYDDFDSSKLSIENYQEYIKIYNNSFDERMKLYDALVQEYKDKENK
jgi:hypothetical protein